MSDFPLSRDMGNGASVSDWLGTAATSARVGALHLEDIRNGTTSDAVASLQLAEDQLTRALEELRAIRSFAAHVAAYGAGERLTETETND